MTFVAAKDRGEQTSLSSMRSSYLPLVRRAHCLSPHVIPFPKISSLNSLKNDIRDVCSIADSIDSRLSNFDFLILDFLILTFLILDFLMLDFLVRQGIR